MNNYILLILALTTSFAAAEGPNFMQTSDGMVVIEAEHFNANKAQGAYEWAVKPEAKASDGEVVIAQPADQVQLNKPEEFQTKGPRIDYKVTFLMSGRHYLWVRAQGAFVHMGLDGTPIINSQRIGGFNPNALGWRFQSRADYGHAAFVEVPTAGEHTINLWMQSSGTSVDKIVLTSESDYKQGDDAGPPESPRGKLPPQAPWVSAGPEKEINPPNTSVKLQGEARDYDGKVVEYAWSQVDGPLTATFTSTTESAAEVGNLTAVGTYHFRLTAKDDSGLSAARAVEVKVTPAVPPTVQVAAEKILYSDSAVDIYPSASDADSDVKAHPLTFMWEQVSGPSPATVKLMNKSQAAISKLIEGTYVFRVSVTDFTGNTTTADAKIIKRPVPPSAAIDADDPRLQYFGRFYTETSKGEKNAKVRESGWPATSIRARFEGTSIRARLVVTGWGGAANFYAIIDGKEDSPIVIGGDNRTDWLVAEGLPDAVHTIELIRLSGAWNTTSMFRGFFLDAGKKLAEPPPRPVRRIEFYGDSITEGSYMSDQPFANAYLAYAATTARLLNAETSLVCKGGIGLIRGFTLPQTLPGVYDRTEPMRGDQKWDFTRWTPQVVVVNIGQNDSWTGADPTAFTDAYVEFIKSLRVHYPSAYIICALGSMDAVKPGSPWPGHVSKAVDRIKTEEHDLRVETFFFDYLGAKGHPSSKQARAMSDKLAEFLEKKGPQLWIESSGK